MPVDGLFLISAKGTRWGVLPETPEHIWSRFAPNIAFGRDEEPP